MEPRTTEGRRLVAAYPGNALDASTPEFILHMVASILAIEAEARRLALEDVEEAELITALAKRGRVLAIVIPRGVSTEAIHDLQRDVNARLDVLAKEGRHDLQ